jgi:hypothetical protein
MRTSRALALARAKAGEGLPSRGHMPRILHFAVGVRGRRTTDVTP